MLDNFDCFGDKLSDESVFSAFLSVVGKLRRGAKPEGKVSPAAPPAVQTHPRLCRPGPPHLPRAALQPRHQHHLRPALSVSSFCSCLFLFLKRNSIFLERF